MTDIAINDRPSVNTYLKATGTGLKDDPYRINSDVNIQDQTTSTLILPMVQELGAVTLAVETVIDAKTFTVSDGTLITIGNHIRIINAAADRYYFGRVLNKVGNVITVDNPIDYVYIVGSEVTYSNQNLNVNGSITPVTFTLRTGAPSIPSSVDINRMIIICETTGAVDLNKFGDLTALTNGLVFRKQNGDVRNMFNIKKNADLVGLAYDFTVFQASNPVQGRNGFACRLTFNGQDKMGVAIRVLQNGNIKMIVQDDLSALIELRIALEGHVVID